QPEVGQHLRFMHRQQVFDGLDLDDDGMLDHDVGAVAARQTNALVNQRERDLPPECQPTLLKPPTKAFLIHLFQQPRPQHTMNLYRQSDNAVGAIPGHTTTIFFFVSLESFVSLVMYGHRGTHRPCQMRQTLTPRPYEEVNLHPFPSFPSHAFLY